MLTANLLPTFGEAMLTANLWPATLGAAMLTASLWPATFDFAIVTDNLLLAAGVASLVEEI